MGNSKSSEIFTNDDLIIGQNYHCFDRSTGAHMINMVGHSELHKYINTDGSLGGRVWANNDCNQALKKWRIFEIPTPDL